jgi:hypothetical protein
LVFVWVVRLVLLQVVLVERSVIRQAELAARMEKLQTETAQAVVLECLLILVEEAAVLLVMQQHSLAQFP